MITESVSVGDLGQEGRKERIRTLLTVWRDSVCCKRESHRSRQEDLPVCCFVPDS